MTGIGEELTLIVTWGERHRLLLARLSIVLHGNDRHRRCWGRSSRSTSRSAALTKTEITSFGDALFFTTVQLLTVSSQIRNPFTPWGRIVDVLLEVWAVIVVAGSAGAVAAFFSDS